MQELTTTPTGNATETNLSDFDFLEKLDFQTFGENCLEKAVKEASRYVAMLRLGKRPYWLGLVGTSGTGKTYLARQIFNYAIRHIAKSYKIFGESEIYVGDCYATTADRLAEMWREQKSGRSDGLCSADLLFIDDIGTTADKSGFITDAMYTLLSRRVGKWTILTSNLDFNGITEQFDARLADRMIRDGNIVVKMDCESYSRRK